MALEVAAEVAPGQWRKLGEIRPGDPPGSISDISSGRREVYIFGCSGDGATISRSLGGLDTADPQVRAVHTVGTEVVRRIGPGESYEMTVQTDASPAPRRVRFTVN